MADSFSSCLAFTLQQEGGWSDDPRDPGGCTMRGVTIASYRSWKQDADLSCHDLALITSDDVAGFYMDMFWTPLQAPNLPLGIDLMVFDAAVNTSIARAVKLLQAQVGVDPDGIIGPATIAAVAGADPTTLIDTIAAAQLVYYQSLDEFSIYGTGWTNRVHARQAAAHQMLATS